MNGWVGRALAADRRRPSARCRRVWGDRRRGVNCNQARLSARAGSKMPLMSGSPSRFVRDNAFIVAAIVLPVVVAGFFLAASAVPRWTVPPPEFDLVLRATRSDGSGNGQVIIDFEVRDGRVHAVLRPAPPQSYVLRWGLLYFDHDRMTVTELPLDLPTELSAGEDVRRVPIEALANARVSSEAVAPDGYMLDHAVGGGPGLVGDIFGIGGRRPVPSLTKGGRVVRLTLPAPYQEPYAPSAYAVGWVLEGGR